MCGTSTRSSCPVSRRSSADSRTIGRNSRRSSRSRPYSPMVAESVLRYGVDEVDSRLPDPSVTKSPVQRSGVGLQTQSLIRADERQLQLELFKRRRRRDDVRLGESRLSHRDALSSRTPESLFQSIYPIGSLPSCGRCSFSGTPSVTTR